MAWVVSSTDGSFKAAVDLKPNTLNAYRRSPRSSRAVLCRR